MLSDPEKKKQYDLYGPEEASSPSHHRNSYSHHDFTRGYESKFCTVVFVVTRIYVDLVKNENVDIRDC